MIEMENSKQPIHPQEVSTCENPLGFRKVIGLTKREYFAAMAMQGLMTVEGWAERIANETSGYLPNLIATASIKMADALLAELEKTNQ